MLDTSARSADAPLPGAADSSSPGRPAGLPRSPVPRRFTAPGWLDIRLVLGVALVLASVVIGAVVMSAADHRQRVWVAGRDLAVGTTVQDGDLTVAAVALAGSGTHYMQAGEPVAGKVITRPLRAGELLARADLGPPSGGASVTVPIVSGNAPRLQRGERITLWLTTRNCRGVVVISGVAVQDLRTSGGGALSSGAGLGIVLRLPDAQAASLIGVLDLPDSVLRVGVLAADQPAAEVSPNLNSCGGRS